MTTRRILKKELVRVACELAAAIERVLNTKLLNTQAIGKAVNGFMRGEVQEEKEFFEDFTMLPLKFKDVPDGTFHLVFERWPIAVTLQVNRNVLDIKTLEAGYESRRSFHQHTRVCFLEVGYRELKRELVLKVRMRPPTEPK